MDGTPKFEGPRSHCRRPEERRADGRYPLLTNDRSLTPAQVLTAHKAQPRIEKRFEQLKTEHEIARVFLKNEARLSLL
jgi:transposase